MGTTATDSLREQSPHVTSASIETPGGTGTPKDAGRFVNHSTAGR